jgi:hypothetical protein
MERGQHRPLFFRFLVQTWEEHKRLTGVVGMVRQTDEGEIRWTSFSLFHGEERWRSECVQIGGIRSARGVLGTWFDKYGFTPCRRLFFPVERN